MLTHYFALAVRNLRRSPVAASINVLTLALGLVSLVTAYAYVSFWSRAERQFENADRIQLLTVSMAAADGTFIETASPHTPEQAAAYLREDFPAVEKIARAITIDRKQAVASDAHAMRLVALGVDPELLEIFALPFVAGDARTALREPRSVVLTEEYAQRLFDGANPIGQHVVLGNKVDATVTGVVGAIAEPSHLGRTPNAPMRFDLLASMDIREALVADMLPAEFRRMVANGWLSRDGFTYLLLPREGLSTSDLSARLSDFAARHVPEQARTQRSYEFGLMPLRDVLTTREFQNTGLTLGTLLLVLGGLVLGVACVNYANLATARAAGRTREVSVRKALGAPPRQILLQSLFEAGVLTAAALAVAIALFLLAGPLLEALLQVDLAPTLFDGLGIWPFLAVLVAGATLAAGAYPAFVLSRVRPATALAAATVRLGSKLFSLLLVGAQFAVAGFLLVVVTIVTLQNAELARTGLGVTSDPLVVIENPRTVTDVDAATLRAELTRLPAVRGVTETAQVPWEMVAWTPVGSSPDPASPTHRVMLRQVGLDFFEVFDIGLLAGRVFDHDRDRSDAGNSAGEPTPREPAVVVDRTFVEIFGFGSPEQALDQPIYWRVTTPTGSSTNTMRIIGVVEDRAFSVGGFGTSGAMMYQLNAGSFGNDVTIARIAKTDVAGALADIRRTPAARGGRAQIARCEHTADARHAVRGVRQAGRHREPRCVAARVRGRAPLSRAISEPDSAHAATVHRLAARHARHRVARRWGPDVARGTVAARGRAAPRVIAARPPTRSSLDAANPCDSGSPQRRARDSDGDRAAP